MHYYIFYCQFPPALCYQQTGLHYDTIIVTLLWLRWNSQPCGGTIPNKPTQCVNSQVPVVYKADSLTLYRHRFGCITLLSIPYFVFSV